MFNPKFVRYEKNNDAEAKFLGIATVSILDGKMVLRYKMQAGKNGGLYSAPMSAKIGEEWFPAFTIDSNIAVEEINSVIKAGMNRPLAQTQSEPVQSTFDDSGCPF